MLLCAGVLTAVMSLDEAFFLHDAATLIVSSEKVLFYLAYAGAAITFFVVDRDVIRP